MLKKNVLLAVTLCVFGFVSLPASAADPCESVLCLYGKATGNSGGSECRGPEKAFFNILKKKKHKFKWNQTFDARKAFLMQCSAADPAAISKIMKKFGKVKG